MSDVEESQESSGRSCRQSIRIDGGRVVRCELDEGHQGPHRDPTEKGRPIVPEVTYVSTPNGPAINPDELAEWLRAGTRSSPDEED